MGWFSTNKCDCCGNDVESGVKSKHCDHWICCNCIVMRTSRTSHMFGGDSMLCPVCGTDTGILHDKMVARCQGKG